VRVVDAEHELVRGIEQAFASALDETVEDARRRAPKRTGMWARSIDAERTTHAGDRLESAIGSPLVSAKVHERGGYITPKRAKALAIPQPDGSIRLSKAVRIPPHPAIIPAARGFGDRFLEKLRRVDARLGGS
jgi:hypothetical protein